MGTLVNLKSGQCLWRYRKKYHFYCS